MGTAGPDRLRTAIILIWLGGTQGAQAGVNLATNLAALELINTERFDKRV